MNIGINGYFGYHNFGDEIFLETWKQLFKEHNIYAINQYTDIKSLDRVIIGGGDLIDVSIFTNAYWRPEFFEVPTYVYGVGVPNMPINEEELKKYTAFFDKCKKIYVRDLSAKNFIIEKGMYATPELVEDIAWGYKLPKITFKKLSSNKIVGISYRFNRNYDWKNLCDIAKQIAKDGFDILLIPLQPAYDPNWRGNDDGVHYELKKIIQQNFPNSIVNIIPDCSDIDHRINFIKSCDYYVTQRLHGMLLSFRVGTPSITLGDSNKFVNVLSKCGRQESLCNNNYVNILSNYNKMKNNEFVVNKDIVNYLEMKTSKELSNFKQIVEKGE